LAGGDGDDDQLLVADLAEVFTDGAIEEFMNEELRRELLNMDLGDDGDLSVLAASSVPAAASRHQEDQNHERLCASIATWAAAVFQAAKEFASVARPESQRPRGDRFVALARFRDQGANTLRWIAWGSPEQLIGRFTSLDAAGRVRYATTTSKRDFTPDVAAGRLQILVPNTTVQMVRARGALAEPMVPELLRIRDFYEAHFATEFTDHVCNLPLQSDAGPSCTICQLTRHAECEDHRSETVLLDALGAASRVGPNPPWWPTVAGSPLDCGLDVVGKIQQFEPTSLAHMCNWCRTLLDALED